MQRVWSTYLENGQRVVRVEEMGGGQELVRLPLSFSSSLIIFYAFLPLLLSTRLESGRKEVLSIGIAITPSPFTLTFHFTRFHYRSSGSLRCSPSLFISPLPSSLFTIAFPYSRPPPLAHSPLLDPQLYLASPSLSASSHRLSTARPRLSTTPRNANVTTPQRRIHARRRRASQRSTP